MKLQEIFRIVLINLIQNKFKVILTSLGIIVGTATIVMVIAIGQGGEEQVAKQFSGLSAETIYLNPNYAKSEQMDMTKMPKLSLEIMNQILDESSALRDMYLRTQTYKEVDYSGYKEFISVAGVTEQYADISNLNIAFGSHITEEDVEGVSLVAVIGDGLAKKLFSSPELAEGQKVKIGNHRYKIIGVLERKGDGLQGLNPDDTLFIPFTTANKNINDEYTIPQAVGLAKDLSMIELAMKEIQSTLNYVLDDGSVYVLEDAGSRIEAALQSAQTMKLLLISVATIVFIVGGIGIMNVLFVSIKERTKEIGILKALGSPSHEILLQFLIESVMISLLGGVVGVLISYMIMPFMNYTDIPVSPSLSGKVIALLFAMITGTLFGIYPAYKASQLKPIEALGQE
ncbi:MAG: ABC transporter permease [Turicibacter sp.]